MSATSLFPTGVKVTSNFTFAMHMPSGNNGPTISNKRMRNELDGDDLAFDLDVARPRKRHRTQHYVEVRSTLLLLLLRLWIIVYLVPSLRDLGWWLAHVICSFWGWIAGTLGEMHETKTCQGLKGWLRGRGRQLLNSRAAARRTTLIIGSCRTARLPSKANLTFALAH